MLGYAVRIVGLIYAAIKKKALAFLAGLAFAVLSFVVLNAAMVPVSKSRYCGSKCHEMNTAYLTWELSPHGTNASGIRVECIDCHLPAKDKYFTHITAKLYEGGKDINITLAVSTTAGRFAKRFWTTYRIKGVCIVMIICSPGRVVRLRELHTRLHWLSPMPRKIDVSNAMKILGISVKANCFRRKSKKGRKELWTL